MFSTCRHIVFESKRLLRVLFLAITDLIHKANYESLCIWYAALRHSHRGPARDWDKPSGICVWRLGNDPFFVVRVHFSILRPLRWTSNPKVVPVSFPNGDELKPKAIHRLHVHQDFHSTVRTWAKNTALWLRAWSLATCTAVGISYAPSSSWVFARWSLKPWALTHRSPSVLWHFPWKTYMPYQIQSNISRRSKKFHAPIQ